MSSINIQGHVANIVVGNVSHSGLSGSVSHLVNSGNITADTGRHLETLLAVVSEMREQHQVQQRQLYDLVKGFSQQLELPSEKRSITTIQAIWEKMVQVSQVSSEVFKAIEKIAPYILPVILGRS
ncbi:MAG: hypothetical protein HOP35_08465 [Nitrospira sp.]|nr:hypothetical protein [Nitrospira sp.]